MSRAANGRKANIKSSEAKKLAQETAELRKLSHEFGQQVTHILRMPSGPSERAQQALNMAKTLADIRRKIASLGNYGGAGALAALEMMSRITETHQEFALAVADGWPNPQACPNQALQSMKC